MAATVATLQALLTADTRDFDQGMDKADSKLGALGKGAGVAFKAVGVAAVAGGVAAAAGIKYSVDAASNLNESMNAVNVVFGKSGKLIQQFGKDAASEAGLSMRELNEAVTPIGAGLINAGLGADVAAKSSVDLAKRAADMASVFNTDVDSALDAIASGLRGEADPLERFGVGLNAAAVNAKAMELGLAGTEKALTAQDKAQARVALIMEQTNRVQGDFASTSDGAANAQRILRAEIENASASIGNAFLPIAAKATTAAADIIPKLLDWTSALGDKLKPAFDTVAGAVTDGIPKLKTLGETIVRNVTPVLRGLQEFIRDYVVPVLTKLKDIGLNTVNAIAKVLSDNEPELRRIMGGIATLAKNIGTVLLFLAENVVIPILKPLFEEVLPVALRITITALDKLFGAIDKVRDAMVWLRDNGGAAINAVWDKAKGPLEKIRSAASDVAGVFRGIAGAIERVIDLVGKIPSVPSWLRPGGDPFDPTAVASLVGGDATIDRGLWGALAGARSFGLALSSGYRPGAITRSGHPSDHGTFPSKAIDVAGSAAGMMAFFRSLIGKGWVKQAFYDPGGSIFGGALSGYREGGHDDHVHVATYDRGGYLQPGWNLAYNGLGVPEPVGAGGNVTIPVSIGGEHIATVVFDLMRRKAQVFERQNGRPAFGGGF